MSDAERRAALERVHLAIRDHHALVYRLAFRLLGNADDAEDAAQDVFLKLLRAPAALAEVESQRAWLARMTWNFAISQRRGESRRRRREERWLEISLKKDGAPMEERYAMEDAVREAIAALPEELRVPVILHYQEGFKYREIAAACDCPEGTVARRLSQARACLRERLKLPSAAVAAAGFEESMAQCDAIEVPVHLEGRLLAAAEAELAAGAASAAAAASMALAAPAGLGKLGISIVLAASIAGASWPALARLAQPGPASHRFEERRPLARLRAASEDAARSESRRHALRSKPRIAAPPAAEASAAEEAGAAVAVEDGTTIIRGRVRDAHGRPLEGVQIIVQRDGETTVLAEAVSDASGAYEIRADGFDARDGEAFWLSRKLRLGISDLTASFSGSFVEDGNAEAAEPAPAEDEERVRYLAAVERAQEEQAERLVRLRMERSRANLEAAEAALKQSAAEADAAAAAAAQAAESFARVEDIEASLRLEEATRLLRYEQSYSLAVKAKWLAYSRDDNGARVRLAARIEGYETAVSAPIEVHNGELVEMDFDLADAQVLRGRVLTASGHPIAGATVTVAARVDELPLPEAGRSLECGDDGGFRFEALPEGVYLLRAEAPGYLPQEIVGSPGSAASVFALAYSGGLRVRVVRGGGGEALAGWNVEIGRGERPLHSTGTLESGEAAFDTLVPGEYRVRAAPPEGEPALGERTAAAWVQAGREVELRIEVWERVETASHPPETAVETAFRVDEAFIIAAVQAEEDAGAAKAAEEPAVRVAVQDRASLRGLMSLAEALGLAWAPRAPLSEDAAIQAAAIVEGPKVGKLRDLLDEAAEMAR